MPPAAPTALSHKVIAPDADGVADGLLSKAEWIDRHLLCPVCRGGPLLADHPDGILCTICATLFGRSPRGRPVMLTPDLAREHKIVATDNVSAMGYDGDCLAVIDQVGRMGGMVLDCGAGCKPASLDHVVNVEIVDYPSTDIIAVGQALPFRDNSFDAVLSIAVLEHVTDPFRCVAELMRVLKPGGRLLCAVPFLQPEHGYPDHYFNMTRSGVRQLFQGHGTIERQYVPTVGHPLFALNWFLRVYEANLPDSAKAAFRDLRLGELMTLDPHRWLDQPVGRDLAEAGRWILACGSVTEVRK